MMDGIREWRQSKIEPVPEGVWIIGKYPTSYLRDDYPHVVLRVLDYYWIVEISGQDGAPTMQRVTMPPTLWRFT